MPRIGDQYCAMWDSPTLFERVRGWNLPNLRHHKERRAFWFLSLRHGQWPNPKGSATFRSARESRSTPQAVNHVRSERLVVGSRGGQGFGSTRGC
ncbi:hypothetical protein ES319_A09G180800v1 [Gossypium barbadense]|uniref:Uncharacterized protein n=2 Tax=Gossypium TaxID=3633 RepID=A0A5J5UH12_GOSBA|nr:hypothetical protein ES319_A09G180800v1 [Gossypium barbadense]KAB2066743.1 hypothetical protein ES319_A09G180800v1 [Gossypium barbadense]TYH03221.1 hypothetical protein ES288_A09G203800v1 [Gossypium darwinii]